MADRPLTIREIQAIKKQKRESEQDKVRIKNLTRLQNIPIQIYGKNSKDAINQLSIQVGPGKSVDLPKYRLIEHQIENLRKRKMISITRIGISASLISEPNDYRKFLPSKKEVIDPTKSSKNQALKSSDVKNKSSKKSLNKEIKTNPAE